MIATILRGVITKVDDKWFIIKCKDIFGNRIDFKILAFDCKHKYEVHSYQTVIVELPKDYYVSKPFGLETSLDMLNKKHSLKEELGV